ncbi:hypothetical protein [Psychrobacter sp. 72-O-c]|uniref:hypothetical protein n=1 Tax=Psychrobacter sp. 72-O-c TaxID=2774125 RepID=UPI001917A80E|nr:hypothetical protein [Psychrobacter sp. 72-O-c]
MKLIKLTVLSAAVLASTAALAADPIVVVDNDNAMSYETAPASQYNSDAGIIRNTTGAIFGGTKTLFNTAINPASVSAEVGSLGYGASVGYSLNDKVELQAGWAGGDVADLFGGNFDVEDVEYDVDSDFSNPYLGVQLRPAANWFTVGAGVIVPDNEIDIESNGDNGNFKINDQEYQNVGTLKGSIKHRNELAPYLTVGFRPNITNNFGVFGEVGAAYLGDVNAKVTASGNGAGPNGAAAAAAAANKELENEDYLEWLPIVKLGATYRF